MPDFYPHSQDPPRCEVIKVSGENGARSIRMGRNSSVILMDVDQPLVWLVTTDDIGYKTVQGFKIEALPNKDQQVNDVLTNLANAVEKINTRLTQIEEVISNGKPDDGNVKQAGNRIKPNASGANGASSAS